jgi:hypothetical protein
MLTRKKTRENIKMKIASLNFILVLVTILSLTN